MRHKRLAFEEDDGSISYVALDTWTGQTWYWTNTATINARRDIDKMIAERNRTQSI